MNLLKDYIFEQNNIVKQVTEKDENFIGNCALFIYKQLNENISNLKFISTPDIIEENGRILSSFKLIEPKSNRCIRLNWFNATKELKNAYFCESENTIEPDFTLYFENINSEDYFKSILNILNNTVKLYFEGKISISNNIILLDDKKYNNIFKVKNISLSDYIKEYLNGSFLEIYLNEHKNISFKDFNQIKNYKFYYKEKINFNIIK